MARIPVVAFQYANNLPMVRDYNSYNPFRPVYCESIGCKLKRSCKFHLHAGTTQEIYGKIGSIIWNHDEFQWECTQEEII